MGRFGIPLLMRPIGKASGAIASFNDGDGSPFRKLVVDIEPVQDLHGYNNPWPAGGGKNKFAMADAVGVNLGSYGLTIDVDASSETVRVHGMATWSGTANKSFRFLSVRREGAYGNAPVTHDYTGLSFKPFLLSTNGTVGVITQVGYDANGGAMTITVTNTSGETNVDFTMQLVAYEGSTAPTLWTPYSNLCSISGRTGCNVWRTGKNLLDVDKYGQTLPRTQSGITWSKVRDGVYHAYGTATGTSYFNVSFFSTLESAMPCNSFIGQRLILSVTDANVKTGLGYFKADGSFSSMVNGGIIPDEAVRLRAYLRIDKDTVIDTDFSVQLELGSTATPYEPYSGNQYIIQLGQTVYGGTLDVTNGVLTVDRACAELNESWYWYIGNTQPTGLTVCTTIDFPNHIGQNGEEHCSHYSVASRSYIVNMPFGSFLLSPTGTIAYFCFKNESGGTVQEFKDYIVAQRTAGTPIQVEYTLATPITIPLTPTQIATLQGQNNVWADSGDVDVEYMKKSLLKLGG